MNRKTANVIKEVAMKAKECFTQSDGDMFRACIGGVWHSGAPLCGRKPTDIGRNFIQECLLLIGTLAIGTDREDGMPQRYHTVGGVHAGSGQP